MADIYEDAKFHFETLRQQNAMELEKRRNKVLKKIPELAELESRREDLLLQLPLAYLQGDSDEEILKQVRGINMSISELLEKNGFSKDQLELRYECEVCSDTGFTGDLIKKPCRCMQALLSKNRYTNNGMGIFQNQTFDNFDFDIFKDTKQKSLMKKAYTYFKGYCKGFPHTDKLNILLMGNTGLGKTYLLNCLCNELIKREVPLTRLSAFRFFQMLFERHIGKSDEGIDDFISVDLLALDDLGSEPFINNVTLPYFLNILNERLTNGKHTVITSNLQLDEIFERYDERITSRLLDSTTTAKIQLQGNDVRTGL